ncbi:MAG: hypothetical protein PVF58_19010 [Candidatus Methanofastidiosia archaeon]
MTITTITDMLLLIDKLSKEQMETLLSGGVVTCDGQEITLDEVTHKGEFKEPFRTAFVLKVLGKTTGTLLYALSLIDCEEGTYGRRIGQELGKDDNYIRQLLNIMEQMGVLTCSEGKGKQKIFTLEEDLIILPKGQVSRLLEGNPVSIAELISRELDHGNINLEELFITVYDESINQIIHAGGQKEKFEVGQLVESLIKSGVVRTFETSSSKRLRHQEFLSFYELLSLLKHVKEKLPKDPEGNVASSDLTQLIEQELHKKDETGELARRYRNYVQYRMRKQIVTEKGKASIDFATLKELIQKKAKDKDLELSAKMRNVLAEDVITSLKGLPITSYKDEFIDTFIDNVLEDRFLITSSEDIMNQVETLMRVGNRLLENAVDIQDLDTTKAREFCAEASLNYLSLLLLLHDGVPPQRLSLMNKAFFKKRGSKSVFTYLVENFSSLRKNKVIQEMGEFSIVKTVLKEEFQAFDVARFLEMYLKMVDFQGVEEFNLDDFIKNTKVVSCMGRLLYKFRKIQMEQIA